MLPRWQGDDDSYDIWNLLRQETKEETSVGEQEFTRERKKGTLSVGNNGRGFL